MDIEVKPSEWILPNRVGFNKYIYNTFHPSKYDNKVKTNLVNAKEIAVI